MVGESRFTFAVCVSCGAQSPPILLLGEERDIDKALTDMGWKYDRLRFNVLARCPKCQEVGNAEVESQATL
jgi:hypothetical protein